MSSSEKLDTANGGLELSAVFEEFNLPASNQRVVTTSQNQTFTTPLALRAVPGSEETTLDSVIDRIQNLQGKDGLLTKALARHGTILFRGLPISSADDFSRFAHAFGYKPHEIIGIVVDRPVLAPNVAPANEAPKHVEIYNHNESPQVPHAPEYIFFYGHKVPVKGGQTPISSSIELFARAQQEIPEFIQKLGEEGLLSRVTYKFDRQYTGGSTLREAFGKEIKDEDDDATRRAKIEAQIGRYGRGKHTTWEWIDDGIIVSHRIPVIRTQPNTNLPVLFTGLAAYWKNSQGGSSTRKQITEQRYGDGTPIPDRYLEKLAKITDEIRVLHKWEKGDVLVYDNIISQHGRQPWEGEQSDRVIMASLFDGPHLPGAYTNADWAQVVQALPG